MKVFLGRNTTDVITIVTCAYQAKNGGIYLDWGNKSLPLPEEFANTIANEIPELDTDAYNAYYKKKTTFENDLKSLDHQEISDEDEEPEEFKWGYSDKFWKTFKPESFEKKFKIKKRRWDE